MDRNSIFGQKYSLSFIAFLAYDLHFNFFSAGLSSMIGVKYCTAAAPVATARKLATTLAMSCGIPFVGSSGGPQPIPLN